MSFAPRMNDSALRAQWSQLKVTEQGLLDGFERFLQMLDLNFKPEDESSVSAVKKLLAGYMPLLMEAMKKTSLDCGVGMLSWNAIIDITKRSWFFEENPKHLVELNPDLKYKPKPDCVGLNHFAHSRIQLSVEDAGNLVADLQKLGIFNKDITVERLILLKAGLLNQRTWIDGLQYPYRVLIPFLTLACLRMKRVEEDTGLDNMVDLDLKPVIIDVLADTVNVLSAMKPTPAAGK